MLPEYLRSDLLTMERNSRFYSTYEKLYDGTTEEYFAKEKVRQDLQDTGFYRVNFARTVVDAPLERTKISGIVCADDKARTILESFWSYNQFDFESKVAHEKAYEYGNSVVLCLPDDEGILTAYVHSPKDVAVFYDPAKPRNKSHAVHIYTQYGYEDENLNTVNRDSEYFIMVVYLPDTIEKWRSTLPIQDRRVDLKTIEMKMVDEIDNPVQGTIPAFHFRTARTPTGRSRLSDVAGPQLMINDTATSLMISVKRAGFRQRYLLTNLINKLDKDNFSATNADTNNADTVTQTQYQAGPDTLMHFEGNDVSVGTFDVSDSSNFTEPIEKMVGWLARVSDTPSHYFTTGATAPSGESYRQGERPLLAVVESCQALFGATWGELFQYVLAFNNTSAEAEVAWTPNSVDDRDFFETQEIKASLGVPKPVLLVEAGYDQATVDSWEQPASSIAPTVVDNDEDLIPPTAIPEEF